MANDTTEEVLNRVREAGMLRPRELEAAGIRGGVLARLARRGLLTRLGRGLYALPDVAVSEHHTLAETAKRVPRGSICLLSALRYHGLTTQTPYEVWVAIGERDWRPVDGPTALRVVRFSGEALHRGVEEHVIDRITVRIYSPAKTVADCFKYRNKIGLDVALEALRDCWGQRRCTMDELTRYARICRVANVMRPYLESLV